MVVFLCYANLKSCTLKALIYAQTHIVQLGDVANAELRKNSICYDLQPSRRVASILMHTFTRTLAVIGHLSRRFSS